MKYRVLIRPEAEDDLEKTFSWYEDKRKGLGYDFLLQVDAGMRFIKRFPYKIIYLVEKDKIIVLAITHGKRRLALLKKRINSI